MSADESDTYQFVLDTVDDNLGVQDLDLWSSRTRVHEEARKNTNDHTVDEAEAAISKAVENDDLFHWHGLLAPARPDHLNRILEHEDEADTTRRIMVGKINGLLRRLSEADTEADAAATEEAGV